MYNNIRIFIQPEDVYKHFLQFKEELKETMHEIASTDTDDFDKKCYLFLTNEGGELFLSLEAPVIIVDSEYCSANDTEDIVNKFLKELEKISNEIWEE